MITIYLNNFNKDISQAIYDDEINKLNINRIQCPKCHQYHMVKHAYYSRGVKTKKGKISLIVLRVKCKECNSTHAVLLSAIIPYSSIQYKDQLRIIKKKNLKELMIDNISIDESDISRVKRNYNKYFKQMLIVNKIQLNNELIINCFKCFKRNFNQIKRGYNILLI